MARAYIALIIGAGVVVVDQVTKHLALKQLSNSSGPDPSILDGWVSLTLTRNQGAAFGVLAGNGTLFVVIALAVSAAIAAALAFVPIRRVPTLVSLGLQIGGAGGNLVDRVRQSYVVDFIQLRHWPIFNVADMSIVAGSALLMYVWVSGGKDNNRASSAADLLPDHDTRNR